jgi:hypothetical protein
VQIKNNNIFSVSFFVFNKNHFLLLATTEKEKKLVHVNKFVPSKKISFFIP